MATGDLTTLANAKSWLVISNTNNDTMLTRLISASSTFLTNWLNRNLLTATYTLEKYNGGGHKSLRLNNWPVTVVSAVWINGLAITASTTGLTDGFVSDSQYVHLLGTETFSKGLMNVSITYTAGYASVPLDIEQACIELVGLKFREKDRIGLSSQALPGVGSNAYAPRDLGKEMKSMLQNYRNVVPS